MMAAQKREDSKVANLKVDCKDNLNKQNLFSTFDPMCDLKRLKIKKTNSKKDSLDSSSIKSAKRIIPLNMNMMSESKNDLKKENIQIYPTQIMQNVKRTIVNRAPSIPSSQISRTNSKQLYYRPPTPSEYIKRVPTPILPPSRQISRCGSVKYHSDDETNECTNQMDHLMTNYNHSQNINQENNKNLHIYEKNYIHDENQQSLWSDNIELPVKSLTQTNDDFLHKLSNKRNILIKSTSETNIRQKNNKRNNSNEASSMKNSQSFSCNQRKENNSKKIDSVNKDNNNIKKASTQFYPNEFFVMNRIIEFEKNNKDKQINSINNTQSKQSIKEDEKSEEITQSDIKNSSNVSFTHQTTKIIQKIRNKVQQNNNIIENISNDEQKEKLIPPLFREFKKNQNQGEKLSTENKNNEHSSVEDKSEADHQNNLKKISKHTNQIKSTKNSKKKSIKEEYLIEMNEVIKQYGIDDSVFNNFFFEYNNELSTKKPGMMTDCYHFNDLEWFIES
ncbi:hypothetical protein TRFO_23120 [Tritrichomonas foetus]|uniref:Uncharacterized protein n=1 Tax=Tritrichomonas foetus TaxID=1144522 RepID=A0A1J4KBT2_9EUKA|nr:hypothetical protein TRFO_23120 [Tritrichomonas foetus]|eukprot:OHT08426.1 hypothetical protein TRFO_23120 [Tritrichomonas foetus]